MTAAATMKAAVATMEVATSMTVATTMQKTAGSSSIDSNSWQQQHLQYGSVCKAASNYGS
jgi:hypothetical protein